MTIKDPGFKLDDVSIKRRETAYDGFMKVDKLQLTHRLFEGGESGLMQRELLIKHQAVGVLLFDPIRDEVLLIRQFRVGALDNDNGPWLLELVAGLVDTEEALENIARRESREEANCVPDELEFICDYYNSPGGSNEKVHLFCGKVNTTEAGGVFGLKDEHEDIQVVVLAYEKAISALTAGKINNAMSIIALQWLQLNKAELCRRWC